eukprot:TRINITY_DN10054_c0_g1_i1.p1 TRINITY_DN10054_c0_g1~~TRINITY_DN10054_c0_g1_i1.p1  ORF type:complete len:164 (+),score=32.32 TRINITY_DN10054_c0_g1_i1:22-492(+)
MSNRPVWTGTSADGTMIAVKSCGILIFRRTDTGTQFLLLRQRNRYDLPKGHREPGEEDMDTAFRELREETGITEDMIDLVPDFEYTEVYYPTYKRFGGKKVEKTVKFFAAFLKPEVGDVSIQLTEHQGYDWFNWEPPISIERTLDPFLRSLEGIIE